MIEQIINWLNNNGISGAGTRLLSHVIALAAVLLIAFIVDFIVKNIILRIVKIMVTKSRSQWDDAFLERKLFSRLAHLAPALVIYLFAPIFPQIASWIVRLSQSYMIFMVGSACYAFFNAVNDVYNSYGIARQRPIKGYIQIAKIITGVIVGILILSVMINKSPTLLLTGLGALTAVIVLVFKDTILGFTASIQLSMNDMVKIGDWIEMPKFGADGEVIDITLHTIKVCNGNKTITSIPTYALISDSFTNWRGMTESGGRRIKRAINIDINSVKFVDQEMYQRFSRFQILESYLKSRQEEIDKYNAENRIDTGELVNGRHMTNLGTFRAYVIAYLKQHPKIHQDMPFMVRHLPPEPQGLPMEIYVFSREQQWAEYEMIQADIFDHLIAVIPRFDLRVFQQPSGNDMQKLANAK